ncbi:MAG: glycosyltransferase [Bacteroidales bacterium]|jgi:glycosyltransferase involved in cell wall biosynthesis
MELTFNHTREFSKLLQTDISKFTETQRLRFPLQETLKMDLHCHDYNSDVPDEVLGRILNVPETWTPTGTVLKTLQQNGCNAFTITNHNNARSCYELQNKGVDILTGAEFSCTVPDFQIGIHVLAYGFTPAQETMLNKLRRNVYAFQEYAVSHDIPTVWAHPLYHYSPKHIPGMAFFNKMSLVFERFEVINGQRDTWQNLLVKSWIEGLTPAVLESNSYLSGIKPTDFCQHPYRKTMTGGSDSHMGIFTGLSGTYLHVPDLEERKKSTPVLELALEAIKKGQMAPYGSHNNNEKLNIAFLDYVCQIAINHKDPGLLRLLLHKGSNQDKMLALVISNAFAELQQHKTTMKFVELFHDSFNGVEPGNLQRMLIKKPYKPVFDEALKIAKAKNTNPAEAAAVYTKSVQNIGEELNKLLWNRALKKIEHLQQVNDFSKLSLSQLLKEFELPVDFRTYLSKNNGEKKDKNSSNKNQLLKFLDGLSFPFLASGMLLAANFTSIKVLYNARPMLNDFSDHLQKYKHPKRMLWLTDTFEDKNGVSMVLKSMLHHIQQHDLPIDILVCSDHLKSEKNLIVVKPDATFTLPFYSQQPIRIPNINKINAIFKEGEYDRVMTSTELPMGLVAQFLKHAYHVPAYFYLHTDWMMFGKKVLHLDKPGSDRLKRFLRTYYGLFDLVFVLNKDQKNWLSGEDMKISKEKVKLTAHWVDEIYQTTDKTMVSPTLKNKELPTLMYAGRISKEKGILELPEIIGKIREKVPDIKVIIAGTGPDEDQLKQLLPQAVFTGWLDQKQLIDHYANADLLLLPSRFDTFSCVVLEAMSCSLPVIAYNTKGPKDIISNGINGFLVNDKEDFSHQAILYLQDNSFHQKVRAAALHRSTEYNAENIVNQLLTDVQLTL